MSALQFEAAIIKGVIWPGPLTFGSAPACRRILTIWALRSTVAINRTDS